MLVFYISITIFKVCPLMRHQLPIEHILGARKSESDQEDSVETTVERVRRRDRVRQAVRGIEGYGRHSVKSRMLAPKCAVKRGRKS